MCFFAKGSPSASAFHLTEDFPPISHKTPLFLPLLQAVAPPVTRPYSYSKCSRYPPSASGCLRHLPSLFSFRFCFPARIFTGFSIRSSSSLRSDAAFLPIQQSRLLLVLHTVTVSHSHHPILSRLAPRFPSRFPCFLTDKRLTLPPSPFLRHPAVTTPPTLSKHVGSA